VLAVTCFLVRSPAANAFGAEVLGCSWNGGAWIANDCGYGDGDVTFSAHNLSGSHSYPLHDKLITASLRPTQSGQSRTVTATATAAGTKCYKCGNG
jgi:hypothetical protein